MMFICTCDSLPCCAWQIYIYNISGGAYQYSVNAPCSNWEFLALCLYLRVCMLEVFVGEF